MREKITDGAHNYLVQNFNKKVFTCLFLILFQSKVSDKQMNVYLFVYKLRQKAETSEKIM